MSRSCGYLINHQALSRVDFQDLFPARKSVGSVPVDPDSLTESANQIDRFCQIIEIEHVFEETFAKYPE